MISNIRNAFIDIIDQSTWMDSDSKSRAIEKVKINRRFNFLKNILYDDRRKRSMKKLAIQTI
jgi:predicted metalloendopeptidase